MQLASSTKITAKPILKWAGGKSQLIEKLSSFFPREISDNTIRKYVEPFLGGGALFFYIAQTFSNIREFYVSDINCELILVYKTIRENPYGVIEELNEIEEYYQALDSENKKNFYYSIRSIFNSERKNFDFNNYTMDWIKRTSQVIFLNRTCFNGLFRVNSKSVFNVPFGDYKNPRICDPINIIEVSQVLKNAIIICSDYSNCESFVDNNTFVYFDPPYRPISRTSSFTAYSQRNFLDDEQVRLFKFYRELDRKGARLLLSNSDPKNLNKGDNFFDELYKDYFIQRISAKRSINRNGYDRGDINELVVTNFREFIE